MGQREGPPVRVPAIQDGPSSSVEDPSVTRGQGDFDCSTATGSVMVSGVDGSVPRRSDPAVRQWSRPADSRHFDRRQGDQDSSLQAVKSTRVETTGHPEGEGPFQGSCQHDVKVPTGIITPSVQIPLVKIRGVL